jgi:ubiquinone/menaquinone biosynthesis C-methylase UbiE
MNDIKGAVQRQFGQVAAAYSVSTVHAKGVDLAEMLNAAQLDGNERVLDAGCGAGHTALNFSPHVAEVVAVDFTEGMLAQGRYLATERNLRNIDFRLADVEQLPFANGEFDVVVSRLSAHHWPHPLLALREFKRVLRPGGRFILSDIVSYDEYSLDTFLQSIELLRDPSHVRDHSAEQWLAMFANAGFAGELVYTWDVWLNFADWVARMATPPVQVAALRALFDNAPAEVRTMLRIEADYSFTLQGGMLRGQNPDDA